MLLAKRLKRKSGKIGTAEHSLALICFNHDSQGGWGNLGMFSFDPMNLPCCQRGCLTIFMSFSICFPLFHYQQAMRVLIHFVRVETSSVARASM
jgi:hypothetical protein